MPRSQIVIEPWKNEAGAWFSLQLATAMNPEASIPVSFFRTIVHSEMPSGKSKEALIKFFRKYSCGKIKHNHDEDPCILANLIECAAKYYDCEAECKGRLVNIFAAVQRGKWDESYAQLRKALKNSKNETTLKLINSVARPSCYFDLKSSDARPNSIADPFFSLGSTGYAWKAADWMIKEIIGVPGVETRSTEANTPELWKACVCSSWAKAVLLDMLLQLGKPENREAVWKKLGEMGIELDERSKERIVSYLQGRHGRTASLSRCARDSIVHWRYSKEAFELARHQWSEKLADVFAVNFNQSKQGIATYKSQGGVEIHWRVRFNYKTTNGPARDVLEWIRYNTHNAPWSSKNKPFPIYNPHSRFVRTLGEYCKVRWSDDVYKELKEYGRSLRSLGNNESQEIKTKEFAEKIGSLGLSFSPPAMFAMTQHLQRQCRRFNELISCFRTPITLFASHEFEVDPGKVSKKNATYIKAALSQPADDENCKSCGACARQPDDSCFFSGAGSFACFKYAINKVFKSGIFFQDSPATAVDDCGEGSARRLQTVSRQDKHTPLPALKLLRTTDGP